MLKSVHLRAVRPNTQKFSISSFLSLLPVLRVAFGALSNEQAIYVSVGTYKVIHSMLNGYLGNDKFSKAP